MSSVASHSVRLPALLLLGAVLLGRSSAASFSYSGTLTPGSSSGTSWVDGGFMPTSIAVGAGTASTQNGFGYFTSHDIGLLTFQFGDLELDNFQPPTPDQWGFMYFSEGNGSIVPFTLLYDGAVIASGTTDHINLLVDNDTDLGASGDGRVTLTTPGSDPAFFNELIAKTGGSGRMNVYLSADAVATEGTMAMGGTFTAVPEPEEYVAIAGLAVLAWAGWRRVWRG